MAFLIGRSLANNVTNLLLDPAVATENSERAGKSRVLGWAAVLSPACLSSSDQSFLGL
jgi:hypothetical protein